VPVLVAQMLERFPKQSPRQLAMRVAVAMGVALLGLWGIFASGWDVRVLLAFFGIEVLIVFVLNWIAISALPTRLDENDRGVVKGWLWLVGALLIGLVAYVFIEGSAGVTALRDVVWPRLRSMLAFARENGLLVAGGGLLLVHVAGLGFDIAGWRRRGGDFIYWSGVTFASRLWFVLAFGFFAWMLGEFLALERTGAVVLLWALFLGADLFTLWLPAALHRKAASGIKRT